MSGLLYKEFTPVKKPLMYYLAFVAAAMVMAIISSFTCGKDDPQFFSIMTACIYCMAFFFSDFIIQDSFRHDENHKWGSFVISSPQMAKGHVQSKYYFTLIMNVATVSLMYVLDMALTAITGSSLAIVLYVLFCGKLILNALEYPFYIRFGYKSGQAVTGGILGVAFLIVWIYGLFGDISFFFQDDVALAIANLLVGKNAGTLSLWLMAAAFWLGVPMYIISCKISEKLYLKGCEAYED